METFLSTACRYLKGESGLPSLLPAKETVEAAKEKSRRVRLFCEGLEKFREMLYTEPVDDESLAASAVIEDQHRESPVVSDTVVVVEEDQIDSTTVQSRDLRDMMDSALDETIHDGSKGSDAVVEDQSIASSVSSGMKMAAKEEQFEVPTERNQEIQDNATDALMENMVGKVSAADNVQNHEHPSSESCYTVTVAEEGHIKSSMERNRNPTDATASKELATSADTLHDQQHPNLESCGTLIVSEEGHIESPIEQTMDTPDASAGTDLTASSDIMQGQERPISEKIVVPQIGANQKSRMYVSTTPGDDLFQSLRTRDKTPPTSPGGASSCSTLVDPSSRKVSPSDSTMGAEASPTTVKDFAYSSWNSNHVRDPVSIVEENTKLELVRQLRKKKMGGEQKACRAAEKKKEGNLTLCADLEAARGILLNREVRADLAKVHANAMILSNFVLRQSMQNIKHGLSHGQHGAKVQMTRSAGETFGNQQKEGSLQNHLRSAGTFAASAYTCTQRLKYSSDTFGEGFNDVGSQRCIQQEDISPLGEIVESQQSSPIEALDQQISEELQVEWVEAKDSATASGVQLKSNAEEFLGRSKGKVDDDLFEKPVSNTALHFETTNSLDPAVSEAIKNVKVHGVTAATDETGIVIFQNNQPTGPNTYKDLRTDDETKVVNNSKSRIEKLPVRQDQTEEVQISSGCSIARESTKSSQANVKKAFIHSRPQNVIVSNDQEMAGLANNTPEEPQGTCIGHEGGNGKFEFSKAAGPATLWGILQSNQCEIQAEKKAYTVEGATGVSDAAGPATLWGILRSNRSDNEAKDRGVVEEEEEVAVVSAVPGPATLWGILQSDAHHSEAGEQQDADDAAAEIPEVEISGPATKSGKVATLKSRVYDLSDNEDDFEVPRDPTNTPVDTTNSPLGDVNSEGGSKGRVDAGNGSAGDAIGAERAAQSKGSEASPQISENIYDDKGAKSGDSDAVARAGPFLNTIPAEKECPEEPEAGTMQASAIFEDLYLSRDNFGAGANGEDHKTSNVALVGSSNTLVQSGDVFSGGYQALSMNPSDTLSPRALSLPQAEVFDFIPPMSQPKGMSKTEKRKLERRRAAAKKAEAKELMRKKEEEVAESTRRKEETAGRAPASLAQRLAEEDAKLGEKRRMLQLARMTRREKVEAALRSLGKSAGR